MHCNNDNRNVWKAKFIVKKTCYKPKKVLNSQKEKKNYESRTDCSAATECALQLQNVQCGQKQLCLNDWTHFPPYNLLN